MKKIFLIACFLLSLSSCVMQEDKIQELESRIEELESELEDANYIISEYEGKLDRINSEAQDGYNAICFFNWSWQLQEALDAFETIEEESTY